jgi:hypothetical protein
MTDRRENAVRRTMLGTIEWPDLFREPEGWRELQERARKERDPRKLEAIIAEMNRLLTEREQKAGNGNGKRPRTTSRRSKPFPLAG